MLTAQDLDVRYAACLEIAKEAGALAKQYFAEAGSLVVELKGMQDQVSVADREVEALIKQRIGQGFPRDVCIGEESGGKAGDALWVIDPIDGTGNFVRGFPHWAVSIGFISAGQVELGAVYDPCGDRMFAARRGAGAFLNGTRMQVRATKKTDESVVCVGFSHSAPRPEFLASMTKLLELGCEFRRVGSAALGLAHTAAGHFDAFWQKKLSAWDVCAGILLVKEAGGMTNDFFADGGLEKGNVMLGACPGLYAEISKAVGVVE